MVFDERSEEFRRSVKGSLSGPVQANRSEDIKSGIGIERKNNSTFINVNMYITGIIFLNCHRSEEHTSELQSH